MTSVDAKQKLKRVEIHGVVIRADGSREDLGRIADSRWWWNRGPGKWLASRRINEANRKENE